VNALEYRKVVELSIGEDDDCFSFFFLLWCRNARKPAPRMRIAPPRPPPIPPPIAAALFGLVDDEPAEEAVLAALVEDEIVEDDVLVIKVEVAVEDAVVEGAEVLLLDAEAAVRLK
jgi:hypothetical protein